MKKRTRFILGFVAAAITFGVLVKTIGPTGFHHSGKHFHACCQKEKDLPAGQSSKEPDTNHTGAYPSAK